ncbi:hypothetical protein GA0061071_11355 [Kosakonia oryzendophytica]|uniref:Uncharacterized protein n=1 Tax=Kosakonia oryzendophytica TaxID=1005665 RepID=A0A1C4DMM8_9ENTR|nr:hypothetical protein [Kosakonia oryzendophytica]SCC32597.1 hypothetical protein GA0061071_11355 [Kosakonia oryzendophytica]
MKSFIFDTLKDLLPILSGVLGVLGVLNVFKKINGKLTAWGWFAVILILLSTIGGVVLAKKEKADDEREKEQLQNKLNHILNDLAKVKRPLGEVQLTFFTKLPNSDPEVESYKEYLKEKVANLPKGKGYGFRPQLNKDIKSLLLDENGRPIIYDINSDSAYWPDDRFPTLQSASKAYTLIMCISLKRIKPEEYQSYIYSSRSGDWCSGPVIFPNNIIYYDIKQDEVGFRTHIKFKKESVFSNGKVSSVQDLFGARVFFQPPTLARTFIKDRLIKNGASKDAIERHERTTSFFAALQAEGASIDTGGGQDFDINGEDIKKYTGIDMNTFFYSDLPLNDREDIVHHQDANN